MVAGEAEAEVGDNRPPEPPPAAGKSGDDSTNSPGTELTRVSGMPELATTSHNQTSAGG